MSETPSLSQTNRLVWTALLAALVAVGAYLHLPLGPIPFSLQPFFVLLAGLILGPVGGAVVLALYVGAGLIGLPVFSGGKSGFAHLLGPTGGFLVGFVAAAALTGLAATKNGAKVAWLKGLAWGLVGLVVMYAIGVARLQMVLGLDWPKALAVGAWPFLPGDVIKLVAAVAVQRYLAAKRLLPR